MFGTKRKKRTKHKEEKMMENCKIKKIKDLSLAALLMTSAMFTACSSSDDEILNEQPVNPTEPKVYTMAVKASKGDDIASTRALSLGTDADNKPIINAWWAEGETCDVWKIESGFVKLDGQLKAQATGEVGGTVTLSGKITGDIAESDMLLLLYPNSVIDYSGQDGTLETIAESYDYAEAIVRVKGIGETGELDIEDVFSHGGKVATFRNMQSIVRFRLMKSDGTTPLAVKSLTISAKESGGSDEKIIKTLDIATDTPTYDALTLNVPDGGTASELYAAIFTHNARSLDITLTATTADGDTYKYVRPSVDFESGEFYSITVKMDKVIDLSTMNNDYTAQDGDVLTGTMPKGLGVLIADPDAKVKLLNVSIDNSNGRGIFCDADVTIILAGTNTISGGYYCSGIEIADENTLTIKGSGSLMVTGSDEAAAIGSGVNATCGNITIEGGTITAIGGDDAAGIGSGAGSSASCGNISIGGSATVTAQGGEYAAGIGCGWNGGGGDISIGGSATVTATGGYLAAGIGSGQNSLVGSITIGNTVTSVTATRGDSGAKCIGAGWGSDSGTIKFGDVVMYDCLNWIEPVSGTNYGGLTLTISGDTWTLTPAN